MFCFTGCELGELFHKEEDSELKIGIAVYKQEDKFISCMVKAIEEYVIKKENDTNSKITINIVDAKGNTTAQNNQVDKFLNQDYDIICVNIVDRTAASTIINKAKKHKLAFGICLSVLLICLVHLGLFLVLKLSTEIIYKRRIL